MCMCECRALCVSMSLGPVFYMRTEAPYLLGYSEPLCFSGPTPAQLRLRFGTPTGPKYCATVVDYRFKLSINLDSISKFIASKRNHLGNFHKL